MRWVLVACALVCVSTHVSALKIDISQADIERALTIARGRESERAAFHAPYIKPIDAPFVERVEVISEFRRVVLTAEEQIARGDRRSAYSTTRANDALDVYRRRVSVRAQVRFHPLNNYVTVPPVKMTLAGNDAALVGVRQEPVYGFSPQRDIATPIMGAVVEGTFYAESMGQGVREFIITLDNKELGRATFDFSTID